MRTHLTAATLLAALAFAPAAQANNVHLYPANPARHSQQATAGTTMLYYGGPVLANVNTVAVIWGGGVAATTVSRIGPFLKALPNSTYLDLLTQYSTTLTAVNGNPGTNQAIGRGTYGGQFKISPTNTALALTDKAIRIELAAQIKAKHLPASNANTLYMVYFPQTITITTGTAQSCVAFGAYHSAFFTKTIANNVYYGVMPDCGGGFNAISVTSSHEFAEAVSDAIPTPGSHPAYPQAWNTSNGYEIGDLCEGHNATLAAAGKNYIVQQEFDNSKKACATAATYSSP